MQEGRRREERKEKERGEEREGMKEEKREERRGEEGERRKQRKRKTGRGRKGRKERRFLQSFQLTLISNFVLVSELEMYIGFALFILTFKKSSKISHPLILL